ncbi:ester cyclase [Micromonospora rifamycinica]|uniref:SnoaL-like polyketide cyclase n=1 Tax=Micromonospora rifamycinica TaxID=291594 RepID=A0A1C5K611_9ACTN|nr:ester cyclase [Micromonospora rifamycinica]SCG77969.1 SnoaL-like polyketide cyclase [Micromonospora rifamycinica]
MNRVSTATLTALLIGGSVLTGGGVPALAGGAAISHPQSDRHDDAPGAQERVVRAWVQLWNGDYALAGRIVSPDVRVRAALLDGGDGSAVRGPAGMVDLIGQIRGAFPDLRFTVEVGPIVDGDHVVVRWVADGTYGGGFPGATAAPGTTVRFTGTDILRVRHGLITDYWLNADTLLLTTQLGVKAG